MYKRLLKIHTFYLAILFPTLLLKALSKKLNNPNFKKEKNVLCLVCLFPSNQFNVFNNILS